MQSDVGMRRQEPTSESDSAMKIVKELQVEAEVEVQY